MSGRHAVRADNFQPGPGTYNLQQVGEVGKDAPHVSMAGRHDTTTTADSVPGPGSYNVQAPRTGGITMAARHEDRVDDWKVAPGTYNVPSASDGPSYSMSGRQELKTEQLAPGPGHYSIDSSIGKAPAASISGRHALKEDRFQPGPGQYSASYEQSKHSAPAYSMRPKTALPHSADSVPAPGTYNISSTVGKDAPAVSMSGRHAVRADNFQPGPGTYNLQQVGEVGKDAPHVSMAGRHDTTTTADSVPGPGSYDVQVTRGGGISMSGRFEEKQDDWKVGPGAYSVSEHPDGPSYSMGARFQGSSSVYAATTNPMHFVRDNSLRHHEPHAAGSQHTQSEQQQQQPAERLFQPSTHTQAAREQQQSQLPRGGGQEASRAGGVTPRRWQHGSVGSEVRQPSTP